MEVVGCNGWTCSVVIEPDEILCWHQVVSSATDLHVYAAVV